MPFTTVPDKASGDVFTEAMWDTYIKDNLNYLATAASMALIETQDLAAPAASITFSAIPGTYNDLRLVVVARDAAAGVTFDFLTVQFNGDTAGNYDYAYQYSSTVAVVTSTAAQTDAICGFTVQGGAAAGLAAQNEILIADYADTTWQKTLRCNASMRYGTANTTFHQGSFAAFWRSTAAITSIVLKQDAGANFAIGTKARLYGIL